MDKKMKRGCVSSDHSRAVDDAKLKYQTLLMEYLDLQKEFVSRKRKLQAAKQKRETISAEIRFLRHRRKYLLKVRAPNTVPNSDIESNAVEGGRNCSTSEAPPRNIDQVLKDGDGEGHENGPEKEVRFAKKRKNLLIHDKVVAKRKISWPDQVTLKV
ncbi:hypothetical protein BUALT_Bualt10G0098600 [Buddleja alternifolia]|uniref:Uncharacterized protein n=1 Tax=Buddleja alternifolia TaxID=168488 RepID=A0AAV6X5N8_9LAMI|nr:hypothetical protein BUALT_Bualt10G0098600 [Buddleja alternifolia]